MSTAIATGKGKIDLHGRDEDHRAADAWFIAEVKKIRDRGGKLQPVDPKKFGAATKGAFLEITRQKGEEKTTEKVEIIPGLYDLTLVNKLATQLGKEKLPAAEISKRLSQEAIVTFGVSVAGEGMMGRPGGCVIAPSPTGYVAAPTVPTPVLGTPVTFEKDGASFGAFNKSVEFERWLPAIQHGWSNHNGWCVDLPTSRVAYMADQAEAMLANLNQQLKNLHGVTIYTIAPRWLRYYSDGSMSTQKSGAYGLRSAPRPDGGMAPLLYDAPAWVVGLKFGDSMVPGRVFVTPEGKFIASDWCQREADKNGGIDLHTGEFTKHTLMSWCAGPGISKFGDAKTKELHGSVRRTQLRTTPMDSKKRAARIKLTQQVVSLKGKELLSAGVDNQATQEESLRYFKVEGHYFGNEADTPTEFLPYLDGEATLHGVGISARFGLYTHTLVIPLDPKNRVIAPRGARYLKTHLVPQVETVMGYCYIIEDQALAKEIVATMKEAF